MEYLPPKERFSVFVYHLKQLLIFAEKYPNHYFLRKYEKHDYIHNDEDKYIINDDNFYIPISNPRLLCESQDSPLQNTNLERIKKKSKIQSNIYFDHPYKGKFHVNNFKSAIEVFSIISMENSEKAQVWYLLAMLMPDTPGYYFDHPTKGRIKIYNFKMAMEVYGLLNAQGDKKEAEHWHHLASIMPDSPYYNK